MNLYRLDPASPMDPLWRKLNGDGSATRAARARAIRLGRPVTVSKIDGRTLRVTPVREATPEGRIQMPADVTKRTHKAATAR